MPISTGHCLTTGKRYTKRRVLNCFGNTAESIEPIKDIRKHTIVLSNSKTFLRRIKIYVSYTPNIETLANYKYSVSNAYYVNGAPRISIALNIMHQARSVASRASFQILYTLEFCS